MLLNIRAGGDRAALNTAFRETLSIWFRRKIVVVEDFHASGDQVVDRVRAETPRLSQSRHGRQNIKGTGLDFVYRWQAWDAAHAATQSEIRQSRPGCRRSACPFQPFRSSAFCRSDARVLAALRSAPPVSGSVFLARLSWHNRISTANSRRCERP